MKLHKKDVIYKCMNANNTEMFLTKCAAGENFEISIWKCQRQCKNLKNENNIFISVYLAKKEYKVVQKTKRSTK